MAKGDVKRKLTAIFSADVEGYSRLMVEDEAVTVKTLAAPNALGYFGSDGSTSCRY